MQPLGNYAVQITWKDGFNQVSSCAWTRFGMHWGASTTAMSK